MTIFPPNDPILQLIKVGHAIGILASYYMSSIARNRNKKYLLYIFRSKMDG